MKHIKPKNIFDNFALSMTKFFRFIADSFFAKRYGHRAVVLETIAGVPGIVAGVCMQFAASSVTTTNGSALGAHPLPSRTNKETFRLVERSVL